ncbi:hypothetical protein MTBLM5_40001 [Magnetospirillum sp. LM-5]|nr:hypothetical protein MTBLM5_40001 [Magnetospirillum sp. LM-5]
MSRPRNSHASFWGKQATAPESIIRSDRVGSESPRIPYARRRRHSGRTELVPGRAFSKGGRT